MAETTSFIQQLLRPNIRSLVPYSCARNEFQGEASVFLDANENPYNGPYNRYPDPLQEALKKKIALIKAVHPENVFLGNGSDESIDLFYRAFCEPHQDNVVAIDPSYGMYQVCADIHDIEYRKVLLDENFQCSDSDLLAACDEKTKLIFVCSPNNPTGNTLSGTMIRKVLQAFKGLVLVDEAYIDFSSEPSFLSVLSQYPNLVVFQTFSKAWACAGIRLGMAFASKEIIEVLNKVKYPYNINQLTQQYALDMLQDTDRVREWVENLLCERSRVFDALKTIPVVKRVYPSQANFLLVKVSDANALYQYLVQKGIIVRNRNNVSLCLACLRITIGSKAENEALLQALSQYAEEKL